MFKAFSLAVLGAIANAYSECMPNAYLGAPIPTTIVLDQMDETVQGYVEKTGVPINKSHPVRFAVSGNPTTGYQWDVAEDTNANNSIPVYNVCGTYAMTSANGQPMMGSGGTYYFTVTSNDLTGTDTLVLEYAQSWSTAAPAKTYTIPIRVVGDDYQFPDTTGMNGISQ